MDGIHSAKLSDDRKAAIKFCFKHLIQEGYVEKSKLIHPDNFQWDDEVCGDADGFITTGIKGRIVWLVYALSCLPSGMYIAWRKLKKRVHSVFPVTSPDRLYYVVILRLPTSGESH